MLLDDFFFVVAVFFFAPRASSRSSFFLSSFGAGGARGAASALDGAAASSPLPVPAAAVGRRLGRRALSVVRGAKGAIVDAFSIDDPSRAAASGAAGMTGREGGGGGGGGGGAAEGEGDSPFLVEAGAASGPVRASIPPGATVGPVAEEAGRVGFSSRSLAPVRGLMSTSSVFAEAKTVGDEDFAPAAGVVELPTDAATTPAGFLDSVGRLTGAATSSTFSLNSDTGLGGGAAAASFGLEGAAEADDDVSAVFTAAVDADVAAAAEAVRDDEADDAELGPTG